MHIRKIVGSCFLSMVGWLIKRHTCNDALVSSVFPLFLFFRISGFQDITCLYENYLWQELEDIPLFLF
jgi:hypothetical protein